MLSVSLAPALQAGWPGLAALLACIFLLKALFTLLARRQYREMRVSSALRGLDPAVYRHFSGLRLPHPGERRPVRIPHVVVSAFGIFVIDTNYSRGAISGNEHDAEWTRRRRFFGRRFPNPFLRSRVQIEALMSYLNLPDPPFHPVVVFTRPCVLDTPHRDAVQAHQLVAALRRRKITVLDSGMVARADARLADLQDALNRSPVTQPHELHVRQAV